MHTRSKKLPRLATATLSTVALLGGCASSSIEVASREVATIFEY